MDDLSAHHVEDASTNPSEGSGGDAASSGLPDYDRIHEAFRAPATGPKFRLRPLADIELDTSAQWLVEGLMPAKGLHVLYGAPGTGKSFLALSAALHVAAGKPWGGRSVNGGGVVYVAAEGGENFANRVVAARIALEIPQEAPFALVITAPNLGRDGDTGTLIAEIRAQTARLRWRPRLVVIDTLSRSAADMNESSSQDVMEFVRNAASISEAFGCVVMPVHHCGKDESKGMRGSSALHGSADAEWMVSRPSDEGPRQLTVEKMKEGPDKGRLTYDLVETGLGEDVAGAKIVTCVARVHDAPAGADPQPKAPDRGPTHEATVLTTLRLLALTEGEDGKAGQARREGKTVSKERFRKVVADAGLFDGTAPAAVKKALVRAWDALEKKGVIDHDDQQLCLLAPIVVT